MSRRDAIKALAMLPAVGMVEAGKKQPPSFLTPREFVKKPHILAARYTELIKSGAMTVNQVRKAEGLSPL